MVTKKVELSENVVTLARRRIKNIFDNGVPVYLGMSGGKDSIVLAHVVFDLIRAGEIDPKQLTVIFVDEEAMHEEVIRVTADWRKKFLRVGARFDWWCIEVKHFNCFNMLTQDESFICWDREQEANWVRKMPPFAKTSHPLLKPREDSYQDFLTRISRDGITITGVRNAESVQRLMNFRNRPVGRTKMLKPIYDWKDTDVWLYIREHGLDFPETYLHLFQVGQGVREMRLSQFFSIDTAKVLVKLSEFDHGLMERVNRREPNAYLASLYWDSEMFGGGGRRRRAAKGENDRGLTPEIDYQTEVVRALNDPELGYKSPDKTRANTMRSLRTAILSSGGNMAEKAWRDAYQICQAGDPKLRAVRALYNTIAKGFEGKYL